MKLSDIDSVAAEHRPLQALFQQHQEALVGLLFMHALADLEEFSRRLYRHIRIEESVLLPVYAAKNHVPRAGKAETFLQEHRMIERSLEEILTAMRGLTPGPGVNKAVVALMDKEIRFKNLLEHHELREEQFLFPRLREAL